LIVKRLSVTLAALFAFLVFAPAPLAMAQSLSNEDGTCPDSNILGINRWDKYLDCDSDNNDAIRGFVFPNDIWLVVLAVFEILTRLSVYIAAGVIIYAGFKFIIAQGNPEKIQNAKTTIQDAVIGLVIAIAATTIISFLAGRLTS